MGGFRRVAALLGIAFLLTAHVSLAQDDEEMSEGEMEAPEGDGEVGDEMPSEDFEHEDPDMGDMGEGEDMQPEDTGMSGAPMTEEQSRKIHELVDANKDGKINLAELMKFHTKFTHDTEKNEIDSRLSELDTDGDLKVSEVEFLAYYNPTENDDSMPRDVMEGLREMEAAKFKGADANKDGHLDTDELFKAQNYHLDRDLEQTVAKVSLKQKDKNGDGFLDMRELFELPEDEEAPDDDFQDTEFKKLDTNGDGKLDVKELAPWESGRYHTEFSMKAIVDTLDVDGDGHASTEEMLQNFEKITDDPMGDGHYHLEQWILHHEL